MIREVPAVIPVTWPVLFTVAMAGLALDQDPPAVVLAKGVVLPTQVENVPVIAGSMGTGSTVTNTGILTDSSVQPFLAIAT